MTYIYHHFGTAPPSHTLWNLEVISLHEPRVNMLLDWAKLAFPTDDHLPISVLHVLLYFVAIQFETELYFERARIRDNFIAPEQSES